MPVNVRQALLHQTKHHQFHLMPKSPKVVRDGDGDLSLYHWKQSVTSTRIEGLHEVEVVVENSKTGKTIYELKTLLFDPPISSVADDSTKKDSGKKKEGRAR